MCGHREAGYEMLREPPPHLELTFVPRPACTPVPFSDTTRRLVYPPPGGEGRGLKSVTGGFVPRRLCCLSFLSPLLFSAPLPAPSLRSHSGYLHTVRRAWDQGRGRRVQVPGLAKGASPLIAAWAWKRKPGEPLAGFWREKGGGASGRSVFLTPVEQEETPRALSELQGLTLMPHVSFVLDRDDFSCLPSHTHFVTGVRSFVPWLPRWWGTGSWGLGVSALYC